MVVTSVVKYIATSLQLKKKKINMEFIRTLREKQQTKRQAEIHQQAEDLITLQDFNNSLFIAYNGTPLAPIDVSWTTKEIVQQLSVFRNNFIQSRMKESGIGDEYND